MSDPRCLIDIDIYLDGRLHGARYWAAVPRIGDLIAVRVDQKEIFAVVSSVVWSETSGAMLALHRQKVLLYVRTE